MGKINLDNILDIVNSEKVKRELDNYAPCYPMLRVERDKLYIAVLLTNSHDNVWDANEKIKGEYWCLLDVDTLEILEFNKRDDKDYISGSLIDINKTNDQKELSIYEMKKIEEYTNYLLNDIKNDNLPIQKKLAGIVGNWIDIDGEKVNINDYIMANIEDDVRGKIKELVDIVIRSKYSNITLYYDILFNNIVEEYKNTNNINYDLIDSCIEIMNNYYGGIVGIKNLFNV